MTRNFGGAFYESIPMENFNYGIVTVLVGGKYYMQRSNKPVANGSGQNFTTGKGRFTF